MNRDERNENRGRERGEVPGGLMGRRCMVPTLERLRGRARGGESDLLGWCGADTHSDGRGEFVGLAGVGGGLGGGVQMIWAGIGGTPVDVGVVGCRMIMDLAPLWE